MLSMTAAQPIVRTTAASPDTAMANSSLGRNGAWNPASYTRQFMGSPISWRMGSFGGRHYVSPSQILTSLECVCAL
jgi:transcription factor SFP1